MSHEGSPTRHASSFQTPTGASGVAPRAVVLLSGGLDSATTLGLARAEGFECHTLAFDYGQRHRHELDAARLVAKHLGATSHRVFTLDFRSIGGSALTDDALAVPKDRSHDEMDRGVPITYVPARNLVFLSIATAIAEVLSAFDVYIGVNAIDYSGYPDCRPEFVDAFARTATLATRAGTQGQTLRVRAPLISMTKAQIIRAGVNAGVDYALTHSCYDPVERGGHTLACGHCDSCVLRREGFVAAGVADPTRYA